MEEGYGDDPAGSVDCGQENGGDGHGMEVYQWRWSGQGDDMRYMEKGGPEMDLGDV